MSAQVKAQHLLLKGKAHLLGIFPQFRHAEVKFRLPGIVHNVKQGHLPLQIAFPVPGDMIQQLHINTHKLLSRPAQAVQRPRLNQVLNGMLIDVFLRNPGDKIIQACVCPPCLAFLHDHVHHGPADALDGGEGIADFLLTAHREARLPLVDVRGQNGDAHAAAGQNVLGDLLGEIDDRGHQGRHEFHGIIIF